MRTHYWSCSALADKIRGVEKPGALEWDSWQDWHEDAKRKHPVRYWLAESGLDWAQTAVHWIPDQVSDFVYWMRVRFLRPSWALRAHRDALNRNHGHDFGSKLLPCIMSELVDFVEIDKALENVRWDAEAREKYCSPRRLFRWPRFRGWRNPQAGLDYLDWEIGLGEEMSHQSEAAKEIKEVYLWWKHIRPQRPDPYEASGWQAKFDKQEGKGIREIFDDTEAGREEKRQMLQGIQDMEQKYHEEDQEMLIRVVRLQRRLW